ncbi:MAG: bifunctional adenosylcobinamide kinase/adenosylcobinamide-phosphate guanylyltransferase [Actinobacteria bacterium]|nr:bifunctional adenosylcobinamide kinase/adenosylcobinamide-phosphate guanylyltransferase [Actinomycetota bacterium]
MLTLVLGGTRSGKSALAEQLAAQTAADLGAVVTYVAMAVVDPHDQDHVRRVAAHQARRPPSWATAECAQADDLVDHLRGLDGVVLVDSLGSWLARHPDFEVVPTPLLSVLRARTRPTLLVSEEVGLAVHPPTALGRRYVDALGVLNQRVAAIADRALLVVAGRTLELGPPSQRPPPSQRRPSGPPDPHTLGETGR